MPPDAPYRAAAPGALPPGLPDPPGACEELALLGPGGAPFALAEGDGAAVRELVRLANAGAAAEAEGGDVLEGVRRRLRAWQGMAGAGAAGTWRDRGPLL